MLSGIDYSYGSGITAAQIKAHGIDFVCRYLSGGHSKDINATELADLLAAGLQVVFVWETAGIMDSEAQGVSDAQGAQRELDHLGCKDAVVFFAADASSEPDLPGYMRGVCSVLGKGRVGIYGGLDSVKAALDADLASYAWQTYAWSNGVWDDRALLQQYSNGHQVGPATVDLDRAEFPGSTLVLTKDDDFGQWPRPANPRPKPVAQATVPDVLGRADSAAKRLIELAGLKAEAPALAPGETGKVSGQSPVSGTRVDKGSTVTLTLDVIKRVQIPDVAGKSLSEAVAALEAAGLKVYAPAVTVAASSPASGGTVTEGSTVKLTLSLVGNPPTPSPHPTPAPVPAPPHPVAEPTLRVGMTGDAVRTVQSLLNIKDDSRLKVDGVFGSNTEVAVRNFQARHGLSADGIVGPATWAALKG